MTLSDTTPTTDTSTTLSKLAKAGDVDISSDETTTPSGSVSTPEDLQAAAQAVTATLHQLTTVEPEVMVPGVTKTKKAPKKKAKKVTKKKATAKATATAKKTIPSSGQSGPALDLAAEDLNDKELKVMAVFPVKGDRDPFTIKALAKGAWPTNTRGKSNSWTRNSLRRLVRAGLVDKLKRGSYRLSIKGRNRMEKAA